MLAVLAGGAGACGGSGPALKPPPTNVERFNADGVQRLEQGDLGGAQSLFEAALADAEPVDDLTGQVEAWSNLGAVARARGDLPGALTCYTTALRIHRAVGTRDAAEARARLNLGIVLAALRRTDEARPELALSLEIARARGEKSMERSVRVALASLDLTQNKYEAARTAAAQIAKEAEAAGDRTALSAALPIEAAALDRLGRLDEARQRLLFALAIDRDRRDAVQVRDDLLALATIAERTKASCDAVSLLGRAARVSRSLGRRETAEAELSRALSLAEAAGSCPGDEVVAIKASLAACRDHPGERTSNATQAAQPKDGGR
jgi:tetratricopeptide (TPR) repeat protein